MNFVRRSHSLVVIRQVPFLLLFVAGFFSLPFLGFSLFLIISGKDADGKYFCLFFGLIILWLFLEYAATRERIEIDTQARTLKRSVDGVFRHRRQTVDLRAATGITVETRPDESRAQRTRRQYVYLDGPAAERILLNSPAKLYLDHRKIAKLLHEITLLPYREATDRY